MLLVLLALVACKGAPPGAPTDTGRPDDTDPSDTPTDTDDTDPAPDPPAAFQGSVRITAGEYHTCWIAPDGSIACWGRNSYRALEAPAGTQWRQISADRYHTCALDDVGEVTCWPGEQPTLPGPFVRVEATTEGACGLRADGTVACADAVIGEPPAGPWASLSCGGTFCCGVAADGALECFGGRPLPLNEPQDVRFAGVSVGAGPACGVRTDGVLQCWGTPWHRPELGGMATVDVNRSLGCALDPSGRASCFGDWDEAPPDTLFVELAVGDRHACGRTAEETVVCWGDDTYDQASFPGDTPVDTGPRPEVEPLGVDCDTALPFEDDDVPAPGFEVWERKGCGAVDASGFRGYWTVIARDEGVPECAAIWATNGNLHPSLCPTCTYTFDVTLDSPVLVGPECDTYTEWDFTSRTGFSYLGFNTFAAFATSYGEYEDVLLLRNQNAYTTGSYYWSPLADATLDGDHLTWSSY